MLLSSDNNDRCNPTAGGLGSRATLQLAFHQWSEPANLTFQEVNDKDADIVITSIPLESYSEDRAIVCQVYAPPVGRIELNPHVNWTLNEAGGGEGQEDFYAGALRVIGYALGFMKSDDPESVMYGLRISNRKLGKNDIRIIRMLFPKTPNVEEDAILKNLSNIDDNLLLLPKAWRRHEVTAPPKKALVRDAMLKHNLVYDWWSV
ncbi:unnamed protein product [Cylicocyclus nassatus]|uniref:Peptidase M10 metallopeptidase domain-containing protein n=1 Tax=Cylicocyclus nassatus TaxID=53992 RepID=A0AA36M4V3_CYLNA|nr:unnamed protein product [Cylicocyclus nassatus]